MNTYTDWDSHDSHRVLLVYNVCVFFPVYNHELVIFMNTMKILDPAILFIVRYGCVVVLLSSPSAPLLLSLFP